MGGPVMRKAADEIAGLEEIVGEGFQDIVEGALAMRPGLEEVPDIDAGSFRASRRPKRGPSPSGGTTGTRCC